MQLNEDIGYQKAVAKYSASFMSDAKWLKLFRTIIASGVSIEHAVWFVIDSPHSFTTSFPSEHDLLPSRFKDGKFQPFEYRWIESVYIPNRFKPIIGVGYEREQHTSAIITALDAVGQFPIEEMDDGVRIYAYRK
jgi:hypothetical protein